MRREARGCKSNGGVPRSMRSWELIVVLIGYVGVSRIGGRHTEATCEGGDWHPDSRPWQAARQKTAIRWGLLNR